MSDWDTGNAWGGDGDTRDALKDVTNAPSTSQDEDGWGKPASRDDGAGSTKDYGGYGDSGADGGGKPSGGCFRCGSEDHMKNECPDKPASGCFRCGSEDHMKSECPEAPKLSGECFNCGQVGHNKADCTNERVARPFTGTCNLCQEEGHRSSECPTAPTKLCKNCEEPEGPGHSAATCTNRRKIQRDPVKDGQAEQAWDALIAAAKEADMDDVKDAMKLYTDALPDVTYFELEEAFRNMNIPVYLVAIEKQVINSFTVVDLQGNIDKTFVVWIRKSPHPSRPYEAEMWPANSEENMIRLKDAGVVESRRAIRCSGCGELGHTRKHCQDSTPVVTQGSVIHCYNCEEDGHRYRDCTKPREDKNACRNCKQPGHESRDCPEPRNVDTVNCNNCGEMGHFSRDCPTSGGGGGGGDSRGGCFNCDATDHMSRDCPLPRDYSRVKCKTCGEMGHTATRCQDAPVVDESIAGVAVGGDVGWGSSANSWDTSSKDISSSEPVVVKTSASGWAKIPKGDSSSVVAANASGDGGWGSSTRPQDYAETPSAKDNGGWGASADSWEGSASVSAAAPDDEDPWGICARDGVVDQFTGTDRVVTSTGSARITSKAAGSDDSSRQALRPLFFDDGKNRHKNYAANPSPTTEVAATGGTRIGTAPHVAPLAAISEEAKHDDLARGGGSGGGGSGGGGSGGGASSPVLVSAAVSASKAPVVSKSSAPSYAYQPARGPVGGVSRPLKATATAFTSQIATPSAEKTSANAVSPTPPVALGGGIAGLRARAHSIAKPFSPPHMATPTRPASDLPFRNMEHLERTPPPRGAEVFFDGKGTESAVVDDEALTPTLSPTLESYGW